MALRLGILYSYKYPIRSSKERGFDPHPSHLMFCFCLVLLFIYEMRIGNFEVRYPTWLWLLTSSRREQQH